MSGMQQHPGVCLFLDSFKLLELLNFYGCIHPDGMALAAMCHDDCHIPNYMVKLQIKRAEKGYKKKRINLNEKKTITKNKDSLTWTKKHQNNGKKYLACGGKQ